jgi:diaminohydroxyphosphoribosylaminopyrimidine deaminase/5-amino-6-(5-phosphoribosylamino)uracil reductase
MRPSPAHRHDPDDIRYMRTALALAARGLGRTWPNPSVGAIIVKDGRIVGAAHTADGGRPHAETEALAQAGEAARGATLYVTLEPCAHTGNTAPCVEAIIAAGIARVVAGCVDVNPLVAQKGFARLRHAGIEVTEGVMEAEARQGNEGFFSLMERKRPFVTLKLATSLDGKIATGRGESQWITGDASRTCAHGLRASHDAILTGMGTILADNPRLTCRLPGHEEASPIRVILDSELYIATDAQALPAWICTSEAALAREGDKAAILRTGGCAIFMAALGEGGLSLPHVLAQLGERGITRLLVEAGSRLASAFVNEGLVDRIYWYRAPLVIGAAGLPALEGSNASLEALPRLRSRSLQKLGEDTLEIFDCGAGV